MLSREKFRLAVGDRGDTLIEVTMALAILGFVLLSSTAIAAAAFRTGQTARERTQVAAAAQGQLEALRSFRDNHSWTEFQNGDGCITYCGVDGVLTTACAWAPAKHCFYMKLITTGSGSREWVPVPGSTTANVPTSVLEISRNAGSNTCGYDFLLHYQFEPLGGGMKAENQIQTRLVNLKYDGTSAGCP